jgi:hypothetical protein
MTAFSFEKSDERSEYAGDTGAHGMPAYRQPSWISACSMSLPDRIATGRSAESLRCRSA